MSKLKKPVTISIEHSETLALLWHLFNHAESVVAGKYTHTIDDEKIEPADLIRLGNIVHRTESGNVFSKLYRAEQQEPFSYKTGEPVASTVVKLNANHHARITPTGIHVPGYGRFPLAVIDELAQAVEKVNGAKP